LINTIQHQNKNFSNNNKKVSFGTFTDQILQHANTTFSTIHHKFLKQIWGDNGTTAKLHHNQVFTDWQNGIYECYIPTRDSTEFNLEYLRVAIQVQELNSNDTKYQDAYQLSKLIKTPHGKIESELLILIAPHQDRWGLVRGFKHRNKPGYFTAVFTNVSSDIIWKRVLDQITNFIQKRLDGLMKSLKIEPWIWKWHQQKEHQTLYYSILEHFSFVLRQSAFTFLELWRHLIKQVKLVLGEIGIQNVALKALSMFEGLSFAQLGRVFSKIRQGLNVEVSLDSDVLKVLEVAQYG
jgi:hypothetical protein